MIHFVLVQFLQCNTEITVTQGRENLSVGVKDKGFKNITMRDFVLDSYWKCKHSLKYSFNVQLLFRIFVCSSFCAKSLETTRPILKFLQFHLFSFMKKWVESSGIRESLLNSVILMHSLTLYFNTRFTITPQQSCSLQLSRKIPSKVARTMW